MRGHMITFGEIKTVDIRKIWKNEATEFTPWLVDNIEHLGNALEKNIDLWRKHAFSTFL